jgi:hypothetical protein
MLVACRVHALLELQWPRLQHLPVFVPCTVYLLELLPGRLRDAPSNLVSFHLVAFFCRSLGGTETFASFHFSYTNWLGLVSVHQECVQLDLLITRQAWRIFKVAFKYHKESSPRPPKISSPTRPLYFASEADIEMSAAETIINIPMVPRTNLFNEKPNNVTITTTKMSSSLSVERPNLGRRRTTDGPDQMIPDDELTKLGQI